MNIRSSIPDDLWPLFEWIQDAHSCKTWGGPSVRYPFTFDTLRIDMQFDSYKTYSLVDDTNELMGLGQVVDIDESRFHLARIMIHPDHQGKGLGFEFCKALIAKGHKEYGKKNVTLKVNLENERAIRLYLRMGFRKATGKLAQKPGIDSMIMILRLKDADRLLAAGD